MKDKQLLHRVAQEIEASSKTSPTAAGPTDTKNRQQSENSAHIDAINQIFTLFRLNYHNQYYKAFQDESHLHTIKKLWLQSLSHLSAEQIVQGAQRTIRESEFLPTLHSMLKYCDDQFSSHGLPPSRSAYMEACNASSPKSDYPWTHPAIYYAGKESDWFFLANSTENKAFPVFERNYKIICQRVINGQELTLPVAKALPETASTPLSNTERQEQMRQLRQKAGF